MGSIGKYKYKFRRKNNLEDQPDNYFIGKISLDNLEIFQTFTKFNESVHMMQAFISSPCLISGILYQSYDFTITGLLILGNGLACTMLQRYNRARVQNVIDKRFGGQKK